MADINRTVLYLSLLMFIVISLADVCQRKVCECSPTNSKKRKVDCSNKGLTEIFPQNEFPKDMTILDLSENNISIVRKGFLDSHLNLHRLYLQNNSIKRLEERAFVGLDLLSRLYLKENKLTELNGKAFQGLTKLQVLDLATNRIKRIDRLAFQGLKSLTRLNLKNNIFTTILNGTFDEFTTLERIDMKQVPLQCNCQLNSFVAFFTRTPETKVLGSCADTKERLVDLKGIDLCEKPPDIFMNPKEDQIVSVGDSFDVTCEMTKPGQRQKKLYWRKNQNSLPKHIKVYEVFNENRLMTLMNFTSVKWQDGGTYMCYGNRLILKEIVITVLTSENDMCSRDMMKVGFDHFLWPVTIERTTAIAPCPWPKDKGADTNLRRVCRENGVWGQVNIGKCQLLSLSEKLILLAKSLKKNDFVDIASVAEQLKLLTDPSSYQSAENITLAFNVFVGIIGKNVPFKGKLLDDMLASFNNIMDVNDGTLYASERKDKSPSRLGAHLELISRGIINETTSHVQSNIVIGSVTKIRLKQNRTCHVFFDAGVWSHPGGVYCGGNKRENYSVSINIPGTILLSLQAAGRTMTNLKLQFLVYRNDNLFPNVISNTTEEIMRGRNVSSSVLAIQMANIDELDLIDPLIIQFTTQPGTNPIVSHFDFGEEVVGKQWAKNSDCVVKDSVATLTTVECKRLVNKNLAIMSHLRAVNPAGPVVYPVEIVVYFGAVVTSLFLIATLVTFIFARKVRFNRDDIIMLMNACLALLIVVLSFAFGIDRTESFIMCRAMGMSLHFFFFASLLWLGSYVVCVTRRLLPRKTDASDEVFNPVLMYYMVSWGVPAIICGMTIAGNITNYKSTEYCWLTESAGLGAFVGPACLLFIVNAVLLVRLHLILARGTSNQPSSEEDTEEEQLQTDQPGAGEEPPEPNEEQSAEKSAMTLNLVATWVVMSLIYLNFILAYFLVNSRTSKVRWILLSYVYALANIALGVAIFSFHCLGRPAVREAWRLVWKQIRAVKITCSCVTWPCRGKELETYYINGRILVNGEDVTHRVESDRQSNITLPSSAALTNDVFVNGRPMSSARLSLLDEVDFPAEESPLVEAAENEVDITETGNTEENRRSQTSVHSDRKSKLNGESASEISPSIPEVDEENQNLLPVPSETPDDHTDITDNLTSKSESSAPTAIEVPQNAVRTDSPAVEHQNAGLHTGMVRPFMGPGGRSFPPSSQALHPHPAHQLRPVFQAPFIPQAIPPHFVSPAIQGQPVHQATPAFQGPPVLQVPTFHQTQPVLIEPPPPTYQRAMEIASQSGSSIGEHSASARSNAKRKRSNESLGSRNESGSSGVRARKLPQNQAQMPSSSISEVPGPVASRPSDSTNARSAAQNLGTSKSRPSNRYRDGRVKPEPKQWNGCTRNRIAYVPIPHVSKIHREPLHNETSV